jgi:uncharacterized membrane protein
VQISLYLATIRSALGKHHSSGFRGSFIRLASREASFVPLQGKLHSSFTISNIMLPIFCLFFFLVHRVAKIRHQKKKKKRKKKEEEKTWSSITRMVQEGIVMVLGTHFFSIVCEKHVLLTT